MEEERRLEGKPAELTGWFTTCRTRLQQKWCLTTGHDTESRRPRWACEIYNGCRTCNEHLSVPCSINDEANEIGAFLKLQCFDEDPVLFVRLYFMLLDEFVSGLHDVANKLLKINMTRSPTLVSVWCNNFAKHRLHIRLQHHPLYVFADAYGPAWATFNAVLPTSTWTDNCGIRRPLLLIDYQWLTSEVKRSLAVANDDAQAVIIIPPLMEFLISTINYFRTFVDTCLGNSELVKQFESTHQRAGCF